MEKTIRHKTIHGLLWSGIERFSVQGINLVVGIMIARQLSPEEYGIIAMLGIFMAVSMTFIDSGFSSALVRKTDRNEADNATVFYFNIAVGFLAMTVMFFGAPLIAGFYRMPVLISVTRLVCLALLFDSFYVVQQAQLTIKIDFRTQAKVSLLSVILSGLVGVSMAYSGWGVWALAWQMVAASLSKCVFFWLIARWRPVAPFSKESFSNLFGFGSKLLVSGLIDTLYNNVSTLIIGKAFSAADLGNFSRARHIATYPSSNLTDILQRVTFPALSSIQNEDERLRANYRLMLRLSGFVIFPLMVGLAVVAQPLVIWILTPKWSEAVPLLQIICFSLMWYPIHAINLNLLKVKGRSDLFLRVEIIKKATGVTVLCATIPMGLIAMCWGQVLSSLIALGINTYYTGKLIGVSFFRQSLDLYPTVIAAFAMGAVVYLCAGWITVSWIQFIAGAITGALFYFGIAALCKMKELNYVLDIIRRKR